MFIVEINDIGLSIYSEAGELSSSPGYAMWQGGMLLVGDAALRQVHIQPQQSVCHFWDRLDREVAPQAVQPPGKRLTHTDFARLHFKELMQAYSGQSIVMVVPAHYAEPQCNILLELARSCRLQIIALIHTPLAAASDIYPHEQLVHLDIFLHRMNIVRLQQQDDRHVSLVESIFPGLLGIQRRCVDVIARNFVRATRFNPFNQAITEQAMYDQLPHWLDRLGKVPLLDLSLTAGRHKHRISQSRAEILEAITPIYQQVVTVIERMRLHDKKLVLNLSERLAALPGFVDYLEKHLEHSSIVPLSAQAIVENISRYEDFVDREGKGALLTHFPCYQAFPEEQHFLLPTHLLFQGVVHALQLKSSAVLYIGKNNEGICFSLENEPATTLFSLYLFDKQLYLQDFNQLMWVNGVAVEPMTVLHCGDVLRMSGCRDVFMPVQLASAEEVN